MAEPNIGVTLKSLRKERGWTLAQMSESTGVPLSSLAKMEKGQLSPTYDQLIKISEGLSIDIAELFATGKAAEKPSAGGRRSVNRAGEGAIVEGAGQILRFLSSDLLDKDFCPMISDLKCRSLEDFGEMLRHPGEEFVYVIEGTFELHTEFYAPVCLHAGESIYFDSSMGHAYIAVGEEACRVLSICSVSHGDPAEFMASESTVELQKPVGNQKPVRNIAKKPGAVTSSKPAKKSAQK